MLLVALIFVIMMLGISFFFIYGTKKNVKTTSYTSDEALNKDMKKKAHFCVETTSASFDKVLDYSESSIRTIDQIITHGWKNKNISEVSKNKMVSIFGAYFGQTFINNFDGHWFMKTNENTPIVYNAKADFEFSPFLIIKEKFEKMTLFDLSIAYNDVKESYYKKLNAQKPF